MASYFVDLHRTMAKANLAYVGISPLKDNLGSLKGNTFCFGVATYLLFLLRSERKPFSPDVLCATTSFSKLISTGKLAFLSPERIESLCKKAASMWWLNANQLKELFSIPTKKAIAFESFINVLFRTLDSFRVDSFPNQILIQLLTSLESFREEIRSFWPFFRDLLQPLEEVVWTVPKLLEEDRDVDFEDLAGTYDIYGKLLYLSENYSGAIKSHQRAIKIREENIGDHIDTSTSLTSIGSVYFEMGNGIEGIKSFQSAFELREQLGIGNNVDTSNIYYTLGDKHFTLGNYKEAIEAHLEALELRKKYLGEHPLTGKSLHRITEVYYQRDSHSATSYCNSLEQVLPVESYKDALTFCQQALAMRLELLGEHMDTAESFHALGCIHDVIGDMSSAVEAFHVASDMRSNVLGDDQDTGESYRRLGLAMCRMGDHKRALGSLQKALQLGRKVSIGDHPGIADITNNIGEVHHNMGNYHSAREQFLNAVDLYEKFFDKHEGTATSYHNLALTHLAMGSYPEALEYFRQASTMRLEVLGQHANTANSFHMLGVVHHKINDFTSAVDAFQKASDMRATLLGGHQDTAESYHNLGLAHSEMGNLNAALESLKKSLQMMKKVSVGDQCQIADNINNIGTVYHKMGDHRSAREQFQNAVDLYLKLLDKHERTATSYRNLGLMHLAMGSYPEALECFKQASTMRLEVLGQHVLTVSSFHELGEVHYNMGDFKSAFKAFQKASDMRSTLLGDHQDTAESYHRLGLAKCGIGDHKGALESLQKP